MFLQTEIICSCISLIKIVWNVTKINFKLFFRFSFIWCKYVLFFFFKHYFNQIISPVRQHRNVMVYINIDFMLIMFVDFDTYQWKSPVFKVSHSSVKDSWRITVVQLKIKQWGYTNTVGIWAYWQQQPHVSHTWRTAHSHRASYDY